jgi:16S rRNA (uracil1498-N3)-methyltransferase
MRRYWVDKDALVNDNLRLQGDVLHHIRDVCRMHVGSRFEVIVSGGKAHLVEIVSETKHESLARVIESREIAPLPEPHIHLAISVPRFPVFEAVVEKSVELGVKEIHPFYSEFSFIKKQEAVFINKRPRFEKIVQGATQQSGRGDLMPIAEPVSLAELLKSFNRGPGVAGLFAYEGTPENGALAVREAMDGMRAGGSLKEAWVFVGSEGGFSEKEVELFRSFGLKPVTLGAQVLRVETACVALTSIIKYGLDLMR